MGIYGYNDFRAYSISHAQNDLEAARIEHSYNDYRDYLSHNWGTSPKMKEAEKKYNAKYYQEHREEILKKRKEERSRNSYKVNEEGWDYTKHDGKKTSWDSEEYGTDEKKKAELMRLANVNAFTDGLTEFDVFNDAADSLKGNKDYPPEVLKNIEENNANVRKNIENLMKTVEEYVKANGDKLSSDEIAKLYKDMDQQVELETKRVIDIGTKEGRAYVDDLLKEGGSGSSSSGPSPKSTTSKTGSTSTSTSTKSSSTSTTTNKDRTPKGSEAAKSVSADQQRSEQLSERRSNSADQKAMKETVDFYKGDKSKIEDDNGAAQDFGEFLAEYGESGGSELSGQAAIDAWVGFRKELGLSTSKKQIETQSRILGDRITRNSR